MMQIEKPKILCEESNNSSFARFTVEPLEKGYGITLGNCMRRVLLSSLPGAAAVAIKIKGVRHEFTTIPGVEEDVVDIVLNLKNLAVSTSNRDDNFTTEIHLNAVKGGKVYAKDFEPNDQVTILNPELLICTLAEGAKFDLTVLIGRGRGYVAGSVNKDKIQDIEYIAIDSLFSPVKKVSYSVEAVRKGQNMDFDKLILEVQSNGTMPAREIISLAGKIILEHISLFTSLCETIEGVGDKILVNKQSDETTKTMELPIEEMDLSVRSYNCLKRANINTIEDITRKTKSEMLKVKNLGQKSLEEVIIKLESMGLSLKSEED
ncbi:MAG: DNA-directed RNA polymerase subunit alpha [Clostridia bacterium]